MEKNCGIQIIVIGNPLADIVEQALRGIQLDPLFIGNEEVKPGQEKEFISNLKSSLKDISLALIVADSSEKNIIMVGQVTDVLRELNIVPLCLVQDNQYGMTNEQLSAILNKKSNFILIPEKDMLEQTRDMITAITDFIIGRGLIGVDIKFLVESLSPPGQISFSTATASGEERMIEAAREALKNLNLEAKDKNLPLLNITGSNNLSLLEVNQGMELISELLGNEPTFTAVIDENFNEKLKVSLLVNSCYP